MSDWDSVTVLRKKAPKASTMKTESAINAARRQGAVIDTQQKCKIFTIYLHVCLFYKFNVIFISQMVPAQINNTLQLKILLNLIGKVRN